MKSTKESKHMRSNTCLLFVFVVKPTCGFAYSTLIMVPDGTTLSVMAELLPVP